MKDVINNFCSVIVIAFFFTLVTSPFSYLYAKYEYKRCMRSCYGCTKIFCKKFDSCPYSEKH